MKGEKNRPSRMTRQAPPARTTEAFLREESVGVTCVNCHRFTLSMCHFRWKTSQFVALAMGHEWMNVAALSAYSRYQE